MYIFLKKKANATHDTVCCENFQETSGCRIPRSSKIVVVDFRSKNLDSVACCNKIQIFGDVVTNTSPEAETDQDVEYHEIESSAAATWYQSSYIMKGFKDAVVDGSSVVNGWLTS